MWNSVGFEFERLNRTAHISFSTLEPGSDASIKLMQTKMEVHWPNSRMLSSVARVCRMLFWRVWRIFASYAFLRILPIVCPIEISLVVSSKVKWFITSCWSLTKIHEELSLPTPIHHESTWCTCPHYWLPVTKRWMIEDVLVSGRWVLKHIRIAFGKR